MASSALLQNIEYGGAILTPSPNEVYTELSQEGMDSIAEFAEEYGLDPVKDALNPFKSPPSDRSETMSIRRWWKIIKPNQPALVELMDRIRSDPRVLVASPVYHSLPESAGKRSALTFSDRVLVKVRSEAPLQQVKEAVEPFGEIDHEQPIRGTMGDTYRMKIKDAKKNTALEVSRQIDSLASLPSSIVKDAYPNWIALTYVFHNIPNDEHFAHQWALPLVGAPAAWDISCGSPIVTIAIVDSGCDVNHPDLSANYVPATERYNAFDGSNNVADMFGHGTLLAGIAAARTNNNIGIAGVAGNCRIMPIKVTTDGDTFVDEFGMASAIQWATDHGAKVINMSWGWPVVSATITDALNGAYIQDIVMVASVGNYYASEEQIPLGAIAFPASHEHVIAVGASDEADARKTPASSDMQCWGSEYGNGLSVMAPGVLLWSTDVSGTAGGWNDTGVGSDLKSFLCISGATDGSSDGNYCSYMGGTSGAAALVSGMAALLLSRYPDLVPDEVRKIIEKTADKVGAYTYSESLTHPNGAWNNEMGYGRVNVLHAMDFAEMLIRDAPSDDGSTPFTGAPFWASPDIVVRPTDDGVFAYQEAVKGQENYIYVRTTNKGPADSRNIMVSVRAVAYVGLEFVHPLDWTAVDSVHIQPQDIQNTIALLSKGDSFVAKFALSATQVDTLYGWQTSGWHPCLLAKVQSDNDYGIQSGVHTWENNNLGQRNFSISRAVAGRRIIFPFIAGHRRNMEASIQIVINTSSIPDDYAVLLNPHDKKVYFPALKDRLYDLQSLSINWADNKEGMSQSGSDGGMLYEHEGVMILHGAKWSINNDGYGNSRIINIIEKEARIRIKKHPGQLRQITLSVIPSQSSLEKTLSHEFRIEVCQCNSKGDAVGGATLVILPNKK